MVSLLRQADFVVYQSEFCRESADRYLESAACSSAVLFNPVDLAAFSPHPNPLPLDEWRLLAAGTHNQPFRVLGAIECVRELRAAGHAARLVIAGELHWSGAETEVRGAIESTQLAGSIELRPRFTQAEAVELLRASHLLLHAKYHDPCPTMVIEAMACGVPVIGSRSGGLPELVGDDGGELIDVPLSWDRAAYPTPPEFAAAVGRIMRDWLQRSQAARARAERLFSSNHWVEAHGRIFRQVCQAAD
jgi:glycosyltransferase involved in cell wall biosynthesis